MAIFGHFSCFKKAGLLHFCCVRWVYWVPNDYAHRSMAIHVGYRLRRFPPRSDQPLRRYVRFAENTLRLFTWKKAGLLHFYCIRPVSFDIQQRIYNMIDIHSGFKTRYHLPNVEHPTMRCSENSRHTLFLKQNANSSMVFAGPLF